MSFIRLGPGLPKDILNITGRVIAVTQLHQGSIHRLRGRIGCSLTIAARELKLAS